MSTIISAKGLSKYYGEFAAIDQVSFDIKKGEIVGLLGLNGAGKSTILKILGTFLLPTNGSARVNDLDVEEDAHQVRSLIGYLPDRPPLYEEMTVVSYLRYVAQLKGVSSSLIDERVAQAIAKTNLKEVSWVRLEELSHGFRQRVGIAQALVSDPKVLILDEPINGLDPVQIVEMRDLIVSLRGNYTVILSSHILSEITKTCDRILIIDQGRLVASGKESELRSSWQRGAVLKLVLKISSDDQQKSVREQLKTIQGVKDVKLALSSSASLASEKAVVETVEETVEETVFMIEVDQDVRANVSRWAADKSLALLEFSRFDDGLEGVFMKLVKNSGGKV
jgi:ABC-2 type transport system ATP-binding protein